MTAFLAFLAGLDTRIFYLLLAGTVWLLIYVWRRVSMASWDAVTRHSPTLEQLPSLVLSALLAAAPSFGKPMLQVVQQAILGVVFGMLPAAGAHYIMKALPIPYNGGQPPPKPPAPGAPQV